MAEPGNALVADDSPRPQSRPNPLGRPARPMSGLVVFSAWISANSTASSSLAVSGLDASRASNPASLSASRSLAEGPCGRAIVSGAACAPRPLDEQIALVETVHQFAPFTPPSKSPSAQTCRPSPPASRWPARRREESTRSAMASRSRSAHGRWRAPPRFAPLWPWP